MKPLKGATVLITGGTGTFGHAFLDKCLAAEAGEVRIFSRDEKKQYDMACMYREYPQVRFFLGDIRDRATIDPAMEDVDFVFHAAAMKQVPSCEKFPMEAVKTNIIGSRNTLDSAIAHKVRKVVCLSTDKAVYPTSAMGMTKAYMEKLALQAAARNAGTDVVITRFGNLIASRGSAVPLFIEQVQNGMPITITDPEMTRFIMTPEEAADLVETAFKIGKNGQILVKKSASSSTGALAAAVERWMGLPEDYPVKYIGMRPGEKMNESLLTEEEAAYAVEEGDYLVVDRRYGKGEKIDIPYRSDLSRMMDVPEIITLIRKLYKEDKDEKTSVRSRTS